VLAVLDLYHVKLRLAEDVQAVGRKQDMSSMSVLAPFGAVTPDAA
jgi:hypothetical protein